MTCKKCIEGNICKTKDYSMTCKKCNNKQFYTRRKNHIPIAFVCSVCGNLVPIKNKKEKESKEKQ